MVAAALITLYQLTDAAVRRAGDRHRSVGGALSLGRHLVCGAVLLALVAVTALPYLYYRRERRAARVLLLTLGAVAILAACCAALTYNLAGLIAGHSSTIDRRCPSPLAAPADSGPAAPAGWSWAPGLVWLRLFGAGRARREHPLSRAADREVARARSRCCCGPRRCMVGTPDRGGRLPQRF